MRRCFILPVAFGILFIGGCGGSGSVVKGKVTVDKKPLTTGTVVYHADKGKGNDAGKEYTGQIGTDGGYELGSVEPGWYRVTVLAQKEMDMTKLNAKPVYLVNPVYIEPTTTPLSVEVKSGAADGSYDLKLKSRN